MLYIAALTLSNIATIVLSLFSIASAFHMRKLIAVRWMFALSTAFFVSSACAVFLYITPLFEDKVFFFQLRVIPHIFYAVIWLYFLSAAFDCWKWLHKSWVLALFLAPCLLNAVLAIVPSTRSYLFTDFKPFDYQGISVIQSSLGSLYPIFYSYAMFVVLLSYLMSAYLIWRERGPRRKQILILNAGLVYLVAESLFSNLSHQTKAFEWLMVTNLSLLISQGAILYAIVRHRFLDLVPLAMPRIFEQFPDPVVILDSRHRVIRANLRAVERLGFPQNYVSETFDFLMPDVKLKSGQIFANFSIAVESLHDHGVDAAGTVVFFRDISEQQRVERELQEKLDFRVQLIAFLAHDLTGFVDSQATLSHTLLESSVHKSENLSLIADAASASQDLVGNVLNWARSQSTSIRFEARPFEWCELLASVCEQMETRCRSKGVKLTFETTVRSFVADGDSELLAAAFRNIISNSLRASSSGSTIKVYLESAERTARVQIQDTGVGMPAERLSVVLENSKEFSMRGIPVARGSGIGLMITRHFIELHRGRFAMTSAVDKGTQTIVTIPL